MDSWPSHNAITEESTPACKSSIAAVCLKTCGDTRLDFNDGYLSLATLTYLARSDWTLSALRRLPCMLGNKGARSAPHGLLEPCLKDTSSILGERRTSLLPALADDAHVGTGAEM